MVGLIHGGDVTRTWDVTATAQSGQAPPHNAGDEAVTANNNGAGFKQWVFVHNTSGTALAIGVPVRKINGTWSVEACDAIDNPKIVAGVPQVVIADDRAGWVLVKGSGQVLDDGAGLAAGALIQAAAAGGVEIVVADADCIGQIGADALSADALGTAYIDCT